MKKISLYCKKCKCSMRVSYTLSGNLEQPVLPGITMKCHRCKRVMALKNCTEGKMLAHTDNSDKLFI